MVSFQVSRGSWLASGAYICPLVAVGPDILEFVVWLLATRLIKYNGVVGYWLFTP